jgi:hypothetical protein
MARSVLLVRTERRVRIRRRECSTRPPNPSKGAFSNPKFTLESRLLSRSRFLQSCCKLGQCTLASGNSSSSLRSVIYTLLVIGFTVHHRAHRAPRVDPCRPFCPIEALVRPTMTSLREIHRVILYSPAAGGLMF